jgi:hypothetical protein
VKLFNVVPMKGELRGTYVTVMIEETAIESGDTCRLLATILKPLCRLHKARRNGALSDDADYSTHTSLVFRAGGCTASTASCQNSAGKTAYTAFTQPR